MSRYLADIRVRYKNVHDLVHTMPLGPMLLQHAFASRPRSINPFKPFYSSPHYRVHLFLLSIFNASVTKSSRPTSFLSLFVPVICKSTHSSLDHRNPPESQSESGSVKVCIRRSFCSRFDLFKCFFTQLNPPHFRNRGVSKHDRAACRRRAMYISVFCWTFMEHRTSGIVSSARDIADYRGDKNSVSEPSSDQRP